ncbi:30S ribosomal protein S17 [Candidatus Roizmanbacteria bacterium RIFCSPHIGHO2_02_FULL_37_15]|uniref:Small ribosomal subunit protein uS17 n=1 Tax=Candidatus Roizmanbacteria bacterium RIFCSPLOWO2_01_FULL_37_16 TaxID=1802058 RepID=A0A1F7IPF3_9BACT|nr:MAG: 30S ribosomal protein S17 [Candidatus Roizmanbacteria bacterium RIFCSPHIGHO2_02_FULL_37_15]OGK33707.1 MAG: 30S ribosomal protein S17 [Candidatus Roizmanbacteria bacterium RIFCSPHIGHO2_12_FULL_36_11]OGK45211.1 MAG: 30S ribosomal protein S17 [Candidatus Roizmanbacteria bacterium RIFCSPLOWO2_01_FULL_37_16]
MVKIFTGKVVSTKMKKTVTVKVERKFRHSVYKKTIIRHKKYKAHNEDFELKEGDMVKIKESRPISKDKHFIVVEKVKN